MFFQRKGSLLIVGGFSHTLALSHRQRWATKNQCSHPPTWKQLVWVSTNIYWRQFVFMETLIIDILHTVDRPVELIIAPQSLFACCLFCNFFNLAIVFSLFLFNFRRWLFIIIVHLTWLTKFSLFNIITTLNHPQLKEKRHGWLNKFQDLFPLWWQRSMFQGEKMTLYYQQTDTINAYVIIITNVTQSRMPNLNIKNYIQLLQVSHNP